VLSAVSAVAAVVLVAAPAPAPETRKATEAFDAGLKLYRRGRYAAALEKFQEAYEAKPHPVVLYNIGKCYERLGDIPKALRNYRDYLRLEPDAKDKDAVTSAIAALEGRLKQQGVQQVLVTTDPPGARVTVDDKELGVSPVSAEISPGAHRVELHLEGYEAVSRGFTMPANTSLELALELKPPPPPVLQPRELSTPPFPVPPLVGSSAPGGSVEAEPPPPSHGRRWTWITGGIAILAGGTGGVLGAESRSASNSLQAQVHSGDEAQRLADRASGFATGANVAYAVAGTAALAAVVLFFTEPHR
jgi:tetratricopeptide (TPR) repeat protein